MRPHPVSAFTKGRRKKHEIQEIRCCLGGSGTDWRHGAWIRIYSLCGRRMEQGERSLDLCENGQTYTGWLETSEGWYYMDLSTGQMTTGFKQIDGNGISSVQAA